MLKKGSLILFLLISMCFSMFTYEVSAVNIDNDGSARDNPYGDSGIEASFDAPYYDCYIPYNMTCEEVGGYATGYTWASSAYANVAAGMTESMKDYKVTGFTNREADFTFYGNGYEEDTGLRTYTDSNGTVFYICALPKFPWQNSLAGSNGFPSWNGDPRKQIFDVILTDGTVIHFMIGDVAAEQHTNGGNDVTQTQFDIIYSFSNLSHEQYRHLFHCQAGHTIEIWGKSGCAGEFSEKYNIGTGDDKNRVAYIRMYAATTDDVIIRNSGVPEGVSYSLGDVTIASNGNSAVDIKTIKSEWELSGMPKQSVLDDAASHLTLPDRGNLSYNELYSIQVTKDSLESKNSVKVYDIVRQALVFMGLALLLYVIILVLAMAFDRVNSFLDISLVSVLSFGALTVSDEKENVGKKGYASSKKMYVSCLVMLGIAMFLISGGVIPAIMKAVNWAIDAVGSLF